ncbi:MAG TPA: tetratricopeptide repeat protein [Oculatellaceae cyanobacterium]|jgi:tetratricopeptide (TPR) repeat protein/S1-C subfamily serine protease
MKPIIVLFTILLLLPTKAIAVSTQKREPQPQQIAQVDLTAKLRSLAQAITVKVTTSDNGGSGTLIGKLGQTYLVLTNAHVVTGDNYRIQTPDGKTHPAQVVPNTRFPNNDLSLLQFRSSQNYKIAPLTKVLQEDEQVLAVGYDSATAKLVTAPGILHLVIPDQPLKGGYQIGYTSNIVQGMSGGAILNAAGELIGINGRAAYPIVNSGFVYQDGSPLTPAEIQDARKVSWGIPVTTFLAQLNPTVVSALSIAQDDEKIVDNAQKFTGWLAKASEQARQISVRIDDLGEPNSGERKNLNGNGSGIIIAKQGNTYYVLTCAHVVKYENVRKYEILAPDGKRYRIDNSKIKKNEGVDLAVVQFTSSTNYQVATLANYNPNNDDYMFVGGYPQLRKQDDDPKWRFNPGQIFDKEGGLLQTKTYTLETENPGLSKTRTAFAEGYELVYTNITYGGMSGGAVLDSLGRVIGIHGSAEGDKASESPEIQLGYSLGIPVATFIGIADRFNVNPQWLQLQNSPAPQISNVNKDSLVKALLTVDVPQGNKPSQWIDRGNQLWRLRRFDEAIAAFDRAIKLQPTFVHLAWYGRGLALVEQGKYETVLLACNQLNQQNRELPVAQKKYEEALVAFETAISKEPLYSPALKAQNLVLRQLKKLERALVAIEQAIKIQPKDANLYKEKAVILAESKNYPQAIAAMTAAINISPLAAYYINLGNIYYDQKQWNQAIDNYNKAMTINPQSAFAYINRGNAYANNQQPDQAIDDFNSAIKINNRLALAYNNRGNVYAIKQQWNQAIKDYDNAIQYNSQYAEAYSNRGTVYYNQKQLDRAIKDYDNAIQYNCKFAEAYNNRGNVYADQGQWDKAIADYTNAIAYKDKYAEAYSYRGQAYHIRENYSAALSDYSKASEINQNLAIAINNIGLIKYEMGETEAAIQKWQKAVEMGYPQAEPQLASAVALYTKGESDKALQIAAEALKLNKQFKDVAYLQKNLWGKRLVADTQKLFADAKMQAVLAGL